ncbi:uncharacterized protein LOC135841499 [Planococcus citri]|uniref:uncharacterized protein LOC135841499 n=1 Tax=Planococcus citri TaxID=170843 RepID=UPI0031F78A61
MFTYRVKPQFSSWLRGRTKSKKKNEAVTPYLDLKKFRNRVGFYICDERNYICVFQQTLVMGWLNNIRNQVKVSKDQKNNKSRIMFNLLLLARKERWEGGTQTLDASYRNTLARAIRKVFKEDAPKLEENSIHSYSSMILRVLHISDNKWDNFGVSKRSPPYKYQFKESNWIYFKKFSKKLGIYICNKRNLTISQQNGLMSLVKHIRIIASATRVLEDDQQDACYKMDDAILEANMTNFVDENNAEEVERRKTLALTLMKIFKETVPRFKGCFRYCFASGVLQALGIPKDEWINFYVYLTRTY